VLYAELHYHKMTSVKSLLVIVLLLAVIFPDVIESQISSLVEKCFTSKASCKYDGGALYRIWCRGFCKKAKRYAVACHRLSYRCYGCTCNRSDIREAPEVSKRILERYPLRYIIHLLLKYIYKLRRDS